MPRYIAASLCHKRSPETLPCAGAYHIQRTRIVTERLARLSIVTPRLSQYTPVTPDPNIKFTGANSQYISLATI